MAMTLLLRRTMDIVLALILAAILALPFAALCLWLLWREGRPLFYVAERMKAPGVPFRLQPTEPPTCGSSVARACTGRSAAAARLDSAAAYCGSPLRALL